MPFWDCFVTLLLHAHFLPSRFDYSLAIILVFAFFSCFTLALPMRGVCCEECPLRAWDPRSL